MKARWRCFRCRPDVDRAALSTVIWASLSTVLLLYVRRYFAQRTDTHDRHLVPVPID